MRAKQTAAFLVSTWDDHLRMFPFEQPSPSAESEHRAYFFDAGIIIRGLLAVWRESGDDSLLDVARAAAYGMIAEFPGGERLSSDPDSAGEGSRAPNRRSGRGRLGVISSKRRWRGGMWRRSLATARCARGILRWSNMP